MSAHCTEKRMRPLLLAATTKFTSVPPLIALDAEIYLSGKSTTFFSVTEVPSIKNFIHHLIVLTLTDLKIQQNTEGKENSLNVETAQIYGQISPEPISCILLVGVIPLNFNTDFCFTSFVEGSSNRKESYCSGATVDLKWQCILSAVLKHMEDKRVAKSSQQVLLRASHV